MILVASIELDKLIGDKKVKDRTDVSRTGIGLAVKKGAPHPDVSTPDALKRTLLAAKSIAQTSIEGGGITSLHVQRVLSILGIREQVSERLKFAKGGPNGRVSVLVASGQAEIGLQQVYRADVQSRCRSDRFAADKLQQITINVRASHGRQGTRRRTRADQAPDDAGGAGDLQGQRARALEKLLARTSPDIVGFGSKSKVFVPFACSARQSPGRSERIGPSAYRHVYCFTNLIIDVSFHVVSRSHQPKFITDRCNKPTSQLDSKSPRVQLSAPTIIGASGVKYHEK